MARDISYEAPRKAEEKPVEEKNAVKKTGGRKKKDSGK